MHHPDVLTGSPRAQAGGLAAGLHPVIAVGFIFAVLVVIAVINLWYGTSGDHRTNPPKTR